MSTKPEMMRADPISRIRRREMIPIVCVMADSNGQTRPRKGHYEVLPDIFHSWTELTAPGVGTSAPIINNSIQDKPE